MVIRSSAMQQRGFTLIELMAVVLLVAILVAVALPTYQNLSRAALEASLSGVAGTLSSASSLVKARAIIDGVDDGAVNYNGQRVDVRSQYPRGHWNRTFRYIIDASMQNRNTGFNQVCSDYKLCGVGNRPTIPGVAGTSGGRGVIVWPEGYRISQGCFAYFYNPENGNAPMIGTVVTGC